MYECSSLESITFADDMPKLPKVGEYWMCDCSKLKHSDPTGFTTLEEVGKGRLRGCPSLEGVMLPVHVPKLPKVGDSWTQSSELG